MEAASAFAIVLEVCVRERQAVSLAAIRERLNRAVRESARSRSSPGTNVSGPVLWRPGRPHRLSLQQLGLNPEADGDVIAAVEFVAGFVEPAPDSSVVPDTPSRGGARAYNVQFTGQGPNLLKVCVYQNQQGLDDTRSMLGNGSVGAEATVLPCASLDGMFDNLIFPADVKERLLSFVQTAMLYARMGVDQQLVNCQKTILLHGPPGTGKTTLAKALAHKIAVRHSDHYTYGLLIEVNAHSVFSKYFSESGKLVQELFSNIKAMAEEQDTFVCVLLDEIESITAARQAALSGSEPSDAIRVVNAVLTQIDQLQKYRNVLLIATTNVTDAIDLAFIDRADIKQYVGLPSLGARYHILHSCVTELIRSRALQPAQVLWEFERLDSLGLDTSTCEQFATMDSPTTSADSLSVALLDVARQCEGMSGRALRKLPFLAHAFHVRRESCTTSEFISALRKTALSERAASSIR